MWTRSLLKSNAKQALQERYWRSVGLCLLLSLLGIGYSFPRLTAQYRVTSSQLTERYDERPGVAGQRRRWIRQRQ